MLCSVNISVFIELSSPSTRRRLQPVLICIDPRIIYMQENERDLLLPGFVMAIWFPFLPLDREDGQTIRPVDFLVMKTLSSQWRISSPKSSGEEKIGCKRLFSTQRLKRLRELEGSCTSRILFLCRAHTQGKPPVS